MVPLLTAGPSSPPSVAITMLLYLVQVLFVLLVIPLKGSLGVPFQGIEDASPAKKTFQSQNMEDVALRFVSDSGVCETTPGVHQMSGYITVGTNMSMVRIRWLLLLITCSC
jgi:hypothetical protein